MRQSTVATRCLGIIVAAVLIAGGCSSSKKHVAAAPTTTTSTATTTTFPVGPLPAVKVTQIATLKQPTSMAERDGDNTIYITEQPGRVRVIRDGALEPTPALDLSSEVSTTTEQGLLGMVFAPNSSLFYLDFTDLSGNTHIVEFAMGTNGTVDLHSRRELMTIPQPFPNHNGGQLAFGPDGLLYIGLGDGGSEGDPLKNGQNLSVLLGKILRISPQPSKDLPYTIPYNNPLAKQAGARGEIWAYGLRNPWRFSFDKTNGNMWIGDVGQNTYEEVDLAVNNQTGGENYGWSLREGMHAFSGDKPTNAVDPVYEYTHTDGNCSVTGGYSYHGTAIPGLTQRYLFADYCTGQVSALTQHGSTWQPSPLKLSVPGIDSFGEDHKGELYVLSQNGQVGRIDPA